MGLTTLIIEIIDLLKTAVMGIRLHLDIDLALAGLDTSLVKSTGDKTDGFASVRQ